MASKISIGGIPKDQPETQKELDQLLSQQIRRVNSVRSRTRGRLGEVIASSLFPASIRDSTQLDCKVFSTPFGNRRLDNFHPNTKHAVESKYLRVSASKLIRVQIAKDEYLLQNGMVSEVIWVLFYGGSKTLLELLKSKNIQIVNCWDALSIETRKTECDPTRIIKIRV
jgi:hypothetical protein